MKIETRVDEVDIDAQDRQFRSHLFPQDITMTFRRDDNRLEWIGERLLFTSDGQIDPGNSRVIEDIADGKIYIGVQGTSIHNPPRMALLKYDYKDRIADLLENPNYGGPLFGTMYGSAHKSVGDLIAEASDLHVRHERQDVHGVACIVLEGTSPFGKATAWIAPEKGYNVMKWIIEKDARSLFDDTMIALKWPTVARSHALFEVTELQEVGGDEGAIFAPKSASFVHTVDSRDGSRNVSRFEYRVSDVQLKPDFDALGAFHIDLPDGTRIANLDFPSLNHVWVDGRAILAIDKRLVPALDAAAEHIAAADVAAPTLATAAGSPDGNTPEDQNVLGRQHEPSGSAQSQGSDGLGAALLLGLMLAVVGACAATMGWLRWRKTAR